ncbi:MAG: type IV secretion system protein [Methylocystaceae bacterium]|nr:MAG: type IV secretion system protein [Methylocystaceae bacterium]
MTRKPSAAMRSRLALQAGLALLAAATFLLVASNVLLLGLRAHDGGLHIFDILTLAPQFGTDERLDRWLTIGFLAGSIAAFGLLGAILSARPRPLHGDARFATPREIEQAGLRAKRGLLLAQTNGRLLTFGGAEHVIVYAPTRSGKGVGVVIPNLLSWTDSVVVLDIKKENFVKTAGFRAARGQKVHLFDPLDSQGRTARYNPLSSVRRDPADLYDDLQRIAGMLFPSDPRGDPFWTEAARSAFIAIGGYIAETPHLPFTIGEILRQLTAASDVKRPARRDSRRLASRRSMISSRPRKTRCNRCARPSPRAWGSGSIRASTPQPRRAISI